MQNLGLPMHSPRVPEKGGEQAAGLGVGISRREESSPQSFSLSLAQQRLWILDRLEPGNSVYNLSFAVRLSGPLDSSMLQRALDETIARHKILRAEFHEERDAPILNVLPSRSIAVSTIDLSTVPAGSRETRALQLLSGEIRKAFDLSRGPLIRAQLVRLASAEHIFLLIAHSIVCDEESLQQLFAEIAHYYAAEVKGGSVNFGVSPEYFELVDRERETLRGSEMQSQLAYWKQRLTSAPASIDLPTDRIRPTMQTFRGSACRVRMGPELYQRIQELSRSHDVTSCTALLAAFNVLLARYSGQDDLVVGTEVPRRTSPQLEKTIGPLANTVVLRTDLSGDPDIGDLLRRTHETIEGARRNQDLPFERLVEELRPERDLSRTPLFQIAFGLPTPATQRLQIPGMKITPVEMEAKTERFDLSLGVVEGTEGLDAKFRYNSDLFDAETISRMAGHYVRLLEEITANPDRRISELPLLSDAEQNVILTEFNRTELDYPKNTCVHELLAAQAKRPPAATAVEFEGRSLTYKELDARANQLANFLRKHGVGREVLVGLCVERSLEMVVALLGILKAGGAYVPLDPAYPADRIKYVLEDARVKVLITQEQLLPTLPSTSAAIICLDPEWKAIKGESEQEIPTDVSSEDLAYVIYTSGSTGKPKGVQLEHRSVVNFLCSMQREPGLNRNDVLVAVTTLAFDIAGLEIYLPLHAGARLVVASREQTYDGKLLAQLIERSGATVMQATPATWRLLFESGWTGNRQLKVLAGGEALPSDLARQLVECCGEVWNMYGPTETTIWSTVYRVEGNHDRIIPIGRPIANTKTYVLDAHRKLVPIGVAGELYVGGEGLARGYFQRPDLTAERFVTDPFSTDSEARMYRTGDLARFLPDGNIQYLGRIDNQVKIRGFRIELGEIESVLAKHAAVQTAVVVAREDQAGDKRLVAYLVHNPGAYASGTELHTFLRESLPEYMIPSAIVEMEALPLTPNGKIDRRALPAPQWSAAEGAPAPAARDELEAMLVKIWQRVLAIPAIGVRDNFFELGGHSLMAARLLSEVEKIVGRRIPLSALFRGATAESLARLIREGGEASPDPVVMEIQSGDGLPFFAIASPGVETLGFGLLARYMGPDQTVYKLQGRAPIVVGRPFAEEDLQALSEEYVAAMCRVQPEGPYCLGGMCEGVQIAERMIHDLEAQGQEVAVFAIFDTWVIQHSQRFWLWRVEYFRQRFREFKRMNFWQQWETAKRAASTQWRKLTGKSAGKTEWYRAYWPEDYKAKRFRAPVVLFKRPKQPFYYVNDPQMGWGERSQGGVEIHEINFDHEELLREPHVKSLGEKLAARIRQVSRKTEKAEFRSGGISLISSSRV
jgi:amino acid adenylation domain-containing protein